LNILLIRLRLIGDVVFTTPAIAAIRDAFPTARLTYLVERSAASIVRGNPHLDEVMVVEHRRGTKRVADDLALAWRLRRRRFDAVVDFHGGPRASLLTWLSGAPVKIGYRVAGRAWMYSHVAGRPRDLRPRHSVENQWDLLHLLDPAFAPAADPRRHPVEMRLDQVARREIDARLVASGVGGDDELNVVHVSAGNPFRRWPAESFVSLLVSLSAAAANRRIILSSGPSDAGAAERIGDAARSRIGPTGARSILTFGDTTIDELRALLERAALFVGGDTGPLHIAATTRTPIVALFGPTLAVRSAPWRDPALVVESIEPEPLPCRPCNQRRCVPGDFRCLTSLAPEIVAAAAERALARGRANRTQIEMD
jgi:ADP-heptose:LPS heptosyltransferase